MNLHNYCSSEAWRRSNYILTPALACCHCCGSSLFSFYISWLLLVLNKCALNYSFHYKERRVQVNEWRSTTFRTINRAKYFQQTQVNVKFSEQTAALVSNVDVTFPKFSQFLAFEYAQLTKLSQIVKYWIKSLHHIFRRSNISIILSRAIIIISSDWSLRI